MRRLSVLFLASAFVLGSFYACQKDKYSMEDALAAQKKLELMKDSIAKSEANLTNALSKRDLMTRDSLAKATGIINYTISVVDAGEASTGKKGLQDLTGTDVTVSQYGKVVTIKTDATGRAFFTDLRSGSVAVTVARDGYATVSVIAEMNIQASNNATTQVSTQIPILPTTGTSLATISGVVTGEIDLTNDKPEPIAGAEVSASLDAAQLSTLFVGSSSQTLGRISKYTISSIVSKATTGADGKYTIKVPTTSNGLQYTVDVAPIKTTQTIFLDWMNGKFTGTSQKIDNVVFGTSVANYSSIPFVSPAFAVIDAPDASATSGSGASATAIMAGGSIEKIDIRQYDYRFSQAPRVEIQSNTGVGAKATAILSSTGILQSIQIDNAGSGYKDATVHIYDHYYDPTTNQGGKQNATATITDQSYEITDIYVYSPTNNNNYDITTPPSVKIFVGSTEITDLKATATLTPVTPGASGTKYKISNIILSGSHLFSTKDANPTITISNNLGGVAPSLTYNPGNYAIKEVIVTQNGSGYKVGTNPFAQVYSNNSTPSINPQLTANVASDGSISSISVVSGGKNQYPFSGISIGTVLNSYYISNNSNYDTYVPNNWLNGSISAPQTIESIQVTQGGSGYENGDHIGIVIIDPLYKVQGQDNATAECKVVNGKVTAVNLVGNTTTKYTYKPAINFVSNNSGSPITAVCGVAVDPNGVVTGLNFDSDHGGLNYGRGYKSLPKVTIKSIGTNGSGADVRITRLYSDGSIDPSGVIVVNGGTGYTDGNKLTSGKAIINDGYKKYSKPAEPVTTTYYDYNLNHYVTTTTPGSAILSSQTTGGTIITKAGKTVLFDAYLGSGSRPNVSK